ncbi:hypothetical protein [Alkalilimnicola ehrlichii]|uniref:Uncharacterized protein n=1 Tax=Alkalilimnicola ehrlichii TaxID=351052 RepID=A0A3E0X2R2_9GAMM|nr:hypothetical protein [Alkalilimnicola ehrlichii]RFA38883.1 hypothetical protein CAL65_02990 [Alkalilimnicola ehrlichii]
MSVQRLLATFVAGSILFYSAVHADEERDLDGMAVIGSEELPKALNICLGEMPSWAKRLPTSATGLATTP